MPQKKLSKIRRVLILGSGALKIGEAGEFDYSGSQAIKALKEEGISTVLVNPNIATNQTSKGLASKVYFLPVNPYFVEKIIAREKPDGILLSFGGQTALNCGLALDKSGVLKKYKVRVLGTPVAAIEKTEDREIFNKTLAEIGVKVPRSKACVSTAEGIKAAEKIGYPVIVRAAFALGGKGSGFAANSAELKVLLENAFAYSPQVLVEENLKGWKEIEYEVVRDKFDNCVTVCNMENFDPLGIHTGESIVVAPSQTLTNSEYHKLREIAIKTIRHLGIIGECNIQYALDPKSEDYRVIEVNARLSRSSALASKATGYPLAHIAAKLALGHSLPSLKNAVTKNTTACFEPALDYLALKIPRWDLNKFRKVSKEITSEMKSVGEIMALGRNFEECLQKGLRMLQVGLTGLTGNEALGIQAEKLAHEISVPTPKRILAVVEALQKGWSPEKINRLSGIDKWFLDKIKNVVKTEREIKKSNGDLSADMMLKAKRLGFSDYQIGRVIGKNEMEVRAIRKKIGVMPSIKQIDTMAAEWPANTNYLYVTYHGSKNDTQRTAKKKAIVLGSGPYCIGSSVEFDWCCVNAVRTLEKEGYETIMINYNPETVSTDYDICDKLYFDELSLERVLDIYEFERPNGVIISTGGQVPNNLALKLHKCGVKILGTSPVDIDRAENRHKFSGLMDKIGVVQPKWKDFSQVEDAYRFARDVEYPVLVRPSYVLSGAAMNVAQNEEDLRAYLSKAAKISTDAPVVISKFEKGAKEIEVDAVATHGEVVIWAIAEHVENAGVHSGDATIVLPPQKLYLETIKRIRQITKQVAKELNITGPFNIQFLAKSNEIKVIECNLRASRSFPFSSKVTGYNFIEIATRAMLGKGAKALKKGHYRTLDLDHVGVKVPQFSFSRLKGADPVLGVEMASTGEVACFGENIEEAFLKAMISVGFEVPKKNILLSIGRLQDKVDFLSSAKRLKGMGFTIFATDGTGHFLKEHGVEAHILHKIGDGRSPNLDEYLRDKCIDLVINIPTNYSHEEMTAGYHIRRRTIDLNIPLITNLQVARLIARTIEKYKVEDLKIRSWDEEVGGRLQVADGRGKNGKQRRKRIGS
ncbi:carbamoyl phosphate synthase large subunit [Candidatus Peregrinibacteria bacterium RIFOXYA2_FULL_41_18]|nr:MAG: carbamoyl phosphate synthase large subunit [Candidatus Peregrinibacteria bacterium RIFOXYA2_FULL_41_18]